MGVRIDFEMFGEKQFSREIERVGERATDARPLFETIRDDWMKWNAEQFMSQGARASGGWEELATSTIRRKGHDVILIATGGLFNELTTPGNVDIYDDWMHMKLPDREDEIGTYHQSGTENMPQRRPLEFTDLDRKNMVRRIQSWVIRGELI